MNVTSRAVPPTVLIIFNRPLSMPLFPEFHPSWQLAQCCSLTTHSHEYVIAHLAYTLSVSKPTDTKNQLIHTKALADNF